MEKKDIEDIDMFCYQCEQTYSGEGCVSVKGVCGKTPEVAALQDLLMHVVKKICSYLHYGREVGLKHNDIDRWVLGAVFSTLTNVNFDETRMRTYLKEAEGFLKTARETYKVACDAKKQAVKNVKGGDWICTPDNAKLLEEAKKLRLPAKPDELTSTKQLCVYGMKGLCAYLDHALQQKYESDEIYAKVEEFLHMVDQELKFEDAVGLALKIGEVNLKVMELLDKANTDAYGHPEITKMKITPVKGKCILVTGHELKDLELVLKQTAGKGINVYTHGEMLPANAYPKLKAFPHLIGNYG